MFQERSGIRKSKKVKIRRLPGQREADVYLGSEKQTFTWAVKSRCLPGQWKTDVYLGSVQLVTAQRSSFNCLLHLRNQGR